MFNCRFICLTQVVMFIQVFQCFLNSVSYHNKINLLIYIQGTRDPSFLLTKNYTFHGKYIFESFIEDLISSTWITTADKVWLRFTQKKPSSRKASWKNVILNKSQCKSFFETN